MASVSTSAPSRAASWSPVKTRDMYSSPAMACFTVTSCWSTAATNVRTGSSFWLFAVSRVLSACSATSTCPLVADAHVLHRPPGTDEQHEESGGSGEPLTQSASCDRVEGPRATAG